MAIASTAVTAAMAAKAFPETSPSIAVQLMQQAAKAAIAATAKAAMAATAFKEISP